MSKLIAAIKDHLLNDTLSRADDLAKLGTAMKRTAGDIRRQGSRLSTGLSASERGTLLAAAEILGAASEAAGSAKRQRKAEEQAKERRYATALKVVEQTFADVIDAGGLVAMLATSGSWRTARGADGSYRHEKPLREDDFSYDAREIQTHERRQALEYFAHRVAGETNGADVMTAVTELRVKFDQVRPGIEAKHMALVQRLAAALRDHSPPIGG